MKYGNAYLPRNILDDEDEIGARVDAALGRTPAVVDLGDITAADALPEDDNAPVAAPSEPTPSLRLPPAGGVVASPMSAPRPVAPDFRLRPPMGRTEPATHIAPQLQAPAIETPQSRETWDRTGRQVAERAQLQADSPWADDAPVSAGWTPTQAAPEDDSDEAPVARPTAMPASTAMPGDENKRAKLRSSDAFGATQNEQGDLADAARADLRSDRWRRALNGIGGILGIAGAATGVAPLAGLGMAIQHGGRQVRPHNERTDAVREQIAARVAAAQGERQYMDTQDERAAASARQVSQDARQATLDEANLGLTRARTGATQVQSQAQAAESAFNEAARTNNAAGMHAAIRARIAAIQHVPTRQSFDSLAADGSPLDRMTDLPSLQRLLAEVADTDTRRGGQGAGGSGGGGRYDTTVDAQGNVVVTRRRRGRGGAPASAPTVTPTGEPASETGQALDVNDPTTIPPWIQRTLNAAGLENQDTITGYLLRWEQAPSDAARAAVLTEVSALAVQAERDNGGGRPAGVTEQEWTRMTRQLTPLAQARNSAVGLASRVTRWAQTRPLALRAAAVVSASGDRSQFDAATLSQADDIVREISMYVNPLLRERSGAAVTDSELRRMLNELSAGRWTVSPDEFSRAIDRQVDTWDEQITTYADDYPPRAVEAWAANHFGGD